MNTRRCLLKLFLHNCDWSGTQLHKQANKTSKQANKETNEHTKISSQKQANKRKQASKPTKKQMNTPRCLLKLFLHKCDWSWTQFHKQASKTSKQANKEANEHTKISSQIFSS